MNPLPAIAILAATGKAAVGGAGLTLASLGGFNLALWSVGLLVATSPIDRISDWTGNVMPLLVAIGAVLAALRTFNRLRQAQG